MNRWYGVPWERFSRPNQLRILTDNSRTSRGGSRCGRQRWRRSGVLCKPPRSWRPRCPRIVSFQQTVLLVPTTGLPAWTGASSRGRPGRWLSVSDDQQQPLSLVASWASRPPILALAMRSVPETETVERGAKKRVASMIEEQWVMSVCRKGGPSAGCERGRTSARMVARGPGRHGPHVREVPALQPLALCRSVLARGVKALERHRRGGCDPSGMHAQSWRVRMGQHAHLLRRSPLWRRRPVRAWWTTLLILMKRRGANANRLAPSITAGALPIVRFAMSSSDAWRPDADGSRVWRSVQGRSGIGRTSGTWPRGGGRWSRCWTAPPCTSTRQ